MPDSRFDPCLETSTGMGGVMYLDGDARVCAQDHLYGPLRDWWEHHSSENCDISLSSDTNDAGRLSRAAAKRTSRENFGTLLGLNWSLEDSIVIHWNRLGGGGDGYRTLLVKKGSIVLFERDRSINDWSFEFFDGFIKELVPSYAYMLKGRTGNGGLWDYLRDQGGCMHTTWKRATKPEWMPFALGWIDALERGDHLTTHVRDAFPWSYLSAGHLRQPIGTGSFRDRIESGEGDFGALEFAAENRWVWRVPTERSLDVRNELAEAGIVRFLRPSDE